MVDVFFIVTIKDNDKVFICREIEEVGLLQNIYDEVTVKIVDSLDNTDEYISMKTYLSIFTNYRDVPIDKMAGMIAYKVFSNTKKSLGFKYTMLSVLNKRRDGYYSVGHLYENYLKAVRKYIAKRIES